jgi:hypothetical protein
MIVRTRFLRGAHATRVLVGATRADHLSLCFSCKLFGESPKRARESRALPG